MRQAGARLEDRDGKPLQIAHGFEQRQSEKKQNEKENQEKNGSNTRHGEWMWWEPPTRVKRQAGPNECRDAPWTQEKRNESSALRCEVKQVWNMGITVCRKLQRR